MTWKTALSGKPALLWDKGETALQSARLFLAEYFPQHNGKAALVKEKSKYVAEIHVEDVHLRVEALA